MNTDPLAVRDRFARLLVSSDVRGVEALLTFEEPDGLEVVTVVDDADRALRQRIYRAEWRYMEGAPDERVTFRVLMRRGRPLSELVSGEDH